MELKPCPFCGGEAKAWEYEDEQDVFDPISLGLIDTRCIVYHCVGCNSCEIVISRLSKDDAAAAWNARAAVTDERFARAVHDGRAWEPVRTCRWELAKRGTVYDVYGCSACGYEYAEPVTDGGVLVSIGDASYCPNCGAKVVGECGR